MLDDPRVNFAISTRGREPGLDHLGIQVEDAGELNEVYARLRQAGGNIIEQGETACCYAKSEKSWIDDPAGISWETFLTTGESITYGDGTGENTARVAHEKQSGACCAPQAGGQGFVLKARVLLAMDVIIYHNPDCGTSRNALGMIRNAGIEPHVIEYLKTPPARALLKQLIARMGISVRSVLREKGTPFNDLGLADPGLTDDQLLDAMMAHPILINRPIVVTPKGVRLCRPSEP